MSLVPSPAGGDAWTRRLISLISEQYPALAIAAQMTVHFDAIKDYMLNHAEKISKILIGGGICVLTPAILLEILGFTAAGIAKGSIAALIQSSFYGAFTGGIFSFFQSIGAAAIMSNPLVLSLGTAAVVGGVGYYLYRWWRGDNDDEKYTGGGGDGTTISGGPPLEPTGGLGAQLLSRKSKWKSIEQAVPVDEQAVQPRRKRTRNKRKSTHQNRGQAATGGN
ncbi:hypothetical protein CPB83DRAFT_880478 [Crepidotus variabilis]|uniref:Uncharacterized protein n=1 Tax=Crepidotus variabilis TaxID=179855 RepID=A0A9P6JT85_9AGAR|nr:hypothetical protein CPB83DRAFT_880478 [Crepidotus variabilis]